MESEIPRIQKEKKAVVNDDKGGPTVTKSHLSPNATQVSPAQKNRNLPSVHALFLAQTSTPQNAANPARMLKTKVPEPAGIPAHIQ